MRDNNKKIERQQIKKYERILKNKAWKQTHGFCAVAVNDANPEAENRRTLLRDMFFINLC